MKSWSSLVLLGVLALNAGVAVAKEQVVQLSVPGMTCPVCPVTVRKALEQVEGVVSVSSSFETKSATVHFDDSKTNIEALRKATADVGYEAFVDGGAK